MGPLYYEPILRITLAMGCDHAYLLSDRLFAGADTLATTYTLAVGIQRLGGADLIFCGEESSDGATGSVPSGLAEWLDLPQMTLLTALEVDPLRRVGRGRRGVKGGYEIIEAPLPCVISVRTACNEPRFWDYRLKSWSYAPQQVTTWTAADLEADPHYIGLDGSPTVVTGLAKAALRERKQVHLEGTPEEIAQQLGAVLRQALEGV